MGDRALGWYLGIVMKRSEKVSQIALLLGLGFSFMGCLAAAETQLPDGSIAAQGDYQGDYYLDRDGAKVKVYRKRDTFVVARSSRSPKANDSSASLQRIATQFEGQIVSLERHNLTGAQVVKTLEPKIKAKGAIAKISGQQLMNSVPGAMPVFTTRSGMGDLMLLPKFTVRLDNNADTESVFAALNKRFSITVERQLKLSGLVYSLNAAGHGLEQFEVARQISQIEGVAWAEPQFFVKPQKAAFQPNDALFSQQWNLDNPGYRGSRCDADCDVREAWDASGAGVTTGAGSVIAIIDDGVQLDHPDLVANIIQGRDFVDDTSTLCGNDGTAGPDDDASPSPIQTCQAAAEGATPDNHGTAVAGIAAAKGGNSIGIAGVAFNASILPVRAFSGFEDASLSAESVCNRIAEAVEYAAQNADVINLSWTLAQSCTALTEAIELTTTGAVTAGTGSKRAGGSPVVAASGNNASGWVKVTVDVPVGEHAFEWRYLRASEPPSGLVTHDDTVWVDDITWPDGSIESFESASSLSDAGFNTEWVLNSCNANCDFNLGGEPVWGINTNPLVNYARSGTKSASINVANSGLESDCGNSYLHILRNGPAGQMSFWVWVSAETGSDQQFFDKFEFLIDGEEVISYGDLDGFGAVDNAVGYPANLSDSGSSSEEGVIAVGASTSGDISGETAADMTAEYRAPYSQYGPTLDIVAPSGDQHLGITTTDRTGDNGYNQSGTENDLNDRNYTQLFSGTSASTPMVAGVAAAILAIDNTLTAQEVKDLITSSADRIGSQAYGSLVDVSSPLRNDFFGFGRVNMDSALAQAASGAGGGATSKLPASCNADAFDYSVENDLLLSRYAPQAGGICPAQGVLPEGDTCFAIRASNGKVAVFCL